MSCGRVNDNIQREPNHRDYMDQINAQGKTSRQTITPTTNKDWCPSCRMAGWLALWGSSKSLNSAVPRWCVSRVSFRESLTMISWNLSLGRKWLFSIAGIPIWRFRLCTISITTNICILTIRYISTPLEVNYHMIQKIYIGPSWDQPQQRSRNIFSSYLTRLISGNCWTMVIVTGQNWKIRPIYFLFIMDFCSVILTYSSTDSLHLFP